MIEIFLIILTLAWLIIASISDLKNREVFNWLNFSLIAFVLAFKSFYAVFYNDLWYFLWGVIGFGICFLLANLFYYARAFAGGDAKLLIGFGAVLPFSSSIYGNLLIIGIFIFLLMLLGGIYSLVYSMIITLINKKKFSLEFQKQFKCRRKIVYTGIIVAIITLIFGFFNSILFIISGVIFILPFIFIYAKSIENSCMIKEIPANKVTVGDWLYEAIRIKGKKIEPNWEGLSEKDVKLIRKYKIKVKIKEGIPFVPSFLLAFLALIYLWYSSWNFFQLLWLF